MFDQIGRTWSSKYVITEKGTGKFLSTAGDFTDNFYLGKRFDTFGEGNEFKEREKLGGCEVFSFCPALLDRVRECFHFKKEYKIKDFSLLCETRFDFGRYFSRVGIKGEAYFNMIAVTFRYCFLYRYADEGREPYVFAELEDVGEFDLFRNCIRLELRQSSVYDEYFKRAPVFSNGRIMLCDSPSVILSLEKFYNVLCNADKFTEKKLSLLYEEMLDRFPDLFYPQADFW